MAQNKDQTLQNIAIVGGGAAGMMAAYFAKKNNPLARVLLVEKNNSLGAKVIISGGGRCNLTTGLNNVNQVLQNYPRGSEFLKPAMKNFSPVKVRKFFTDLGVDLKIEADNRVFPVSNDGHQLVSALQKALKELGVEIMLNSSITQILTLFPDQGQKKQTRSQQESTAKSSSSSARFRLLFNEDLGLDCHSLILTTGGSAYLKTGSTGDGYAFARNLGHTITPLNPALCWLRTAEKWSHELSGISIKNTTISLYENNRRVLISPNRPFLFTHCGISGPGTFAFSSLIANKNFSDQTDLKISIDLLPTIDKHQLDQALQQLFQKFSKKTLENILTQDLPEYLKIEQNKFLLPHRLINQILLNLHKQNPNIPDGLNQKLSLVKGAEVSRTVREAVVSGLKELKMTIVGRGAGDEIVTAGGVDLTEVDPKTMESRLRRALYFAGELLDIDGFTGGFNLQAAWCTGALAGQNASKNL